MRIMGFARLWAKLNQAQFTTFRFTRQDKDWELDEMVEVVFQPQSKNREILGVARITAKEERQPSTISTKEAKEDGFSDRYALVRYLYRDYVGPGTLGPVNKLTLKWVSRRQCETTKS